MAIIDELKKDCLFFLNDHRLDIFFVRKKNTLSENKRDDRSALVSQNVDQKKYNEPDWVDFVSLRCMIEQTAFTYCTLE